MRNFIYIILLSVVIGFYGCQSDKKNTSHQQQEIKKEITPDFVNGKIVDTFYLSNTYPKMSPEIENVLDSLKFCQIVVDKNVPDSLQFFPCSNEFFGIFENNSKDWKNGFIMESAQGVWAKSSRVFNVEFDGETFIVTNDMKGQLLFLVRRDSGKHDMVIRHYDSQVGFIGILHQWKGKNYKPTEVVLVNDYPIKPEFKDSLNKVYLENFIWGY